MSISTNDNKQITAVNGSDEKRCGSFESNIILLGDSVMKGVIFNKTSAHGECTGRYSLFGENGFEHLISNGINLVNRSRMGATVRFARDNLNRLLNNQCIEKSCIVLEYGGNDCDFDWSQVSASPDSEHLPNTPPEDFIRIYGELITALRQSGAYVALTNLVPIDPDKYFLRISQGRNADNILKWLGDRSMLYRWQEYYNVLVEKLAQNYCCPLIDIRGAFLRSHNYSSLLSDDGIHPSAAGHALLRQEICCNANILTAL